MKDLFKIVFIISFISSCYSLAAQEISYLRGSNFIWETKIISDNVWTCTSDGIIVRDLNGTIIITYTTDNGLIDNNVTSMAEDLDGNLWFGTYFGVSMFDGINWITFTEDNGLVGNSISSIAVDQGGNIWFATYSYGLSCYDGTNWINFSTSNGLITNYLLDIAIDSSSNVWCATAYDGILFYDISTDTWTNYNSSNSGLTTNNTHVLTFDGNNKLWIGLTYYHLLSFDGSTWETYDDYEGYTGWCTRSITEDNQGNLWIGSFNGVFMLDSSGFVSHDLSTPNESRCINSIAQDSSGNLWFGSEAGLFQFDNSNITWFSDSETFYNNRIQTTAIDVNGNKWFGMYNDGIYMFDGSNYTHYTDEDGLNNNRAFCILIDSANSIWAITGLYLFSLEGDSWVMNTDIGWAYSGAIDSNGNIWVRTSSVVKKYDGTSVTTYYSDDLLISGDLNCITVDMNDNVWIGTVDGEISGFDGISWTSYTDEDENYRITDIEVDIFGKVWITADGDVFCFDGSEWILHTVDEGLEYGFASCVESDNVGNVWVAGYAGGVAMYDPTLDDGYANPWTIISKPDKWYQDISDIEISSNEVWLSSMMGAIVITDILELHEDTAMFKECINNNEVTFTLHVENPSDIPREYVYTNDLDIPLDWALSATYNGNDLFNEQIITIDSNTTIPLELIFTTDSTTTIGKCKIRMTSESDSNIFKEATCWVNYGVTDLVLFGDGNYPLVNNVSFSPEQYFYLYEDVFIEEGNSTYGKVFADGLAIGYNLNALQSLENIYAHIGWSCPAFKEEQSQALMDFMDSGGNLFISGQDIAWDIDFTGGTATNATNQMFFSDYISATYVSDGNSNLLGIEPSSADSIFGNTSPSTISDVYGGGNVYPDIIAPINGAIPIFQYSLNNNYKAGLRRQTANYKLVYLSVGVEMLSDSLVAKDIINKSYVWFHPQSAISGFTSDIVSLTVYPNPSADFIHVNLEELPASRYSLYIVNSIGEIIKQINTASGFVEINVSKYSCGEYFLSLTNAQGHVIGVSSFIVTE